MRSTRRPLYGTFTVTCLTIQPAAAQQSTAPEVLEYKGTVAAAREAEVAPRLDGLLSEINFVSGQLMKKGDLLFAFASKSNELTLALAQATLKRTEAQLRLAEGESQEQADLAHAERCLRNGVSGS